MPMYREDAKGRIRALKAECVDMFRGEMNNADSFCFDYEDCTATVSEYASYLTGDELRACFKKAIRSAA